MNFKDMQCRQICKKDYRYCRRRREKVYCRKIRLYVEQIKISKQEELERKFCNKDYLIGTDTFDSIGDDIGKEEYLENEIFFETM